MINIECNTTMQLNIMVHVSHSNSGHPPEVNLPPPNSVYVEPAIATSPTFHDWIYFFILPPPLYEL